MPPLRFHGALRPVKERRDSQAVPPFRNRGPLPASAPFVKEQQRDQAEDAAPQDHADLKPAAAREFMPPCETQAMEQGQYQAERQGKGSPAGRERDLGREGLPVFMGERQAEGEDGVGKVMLPDALGTGHVVRKGP